MGFKHLFWLTAAVCVIISAGLALGDGDRRLGLAFCGAALVFTLAGIPFARHGM